MRRPQSPLRDQSPPSGLITSEAATSETAHQIKVDEVREANESRWDSAGQPWVSREPEFHQRLEPVAAHGHTNYN